MGCIVSSSADGTTSITTPSEVDAKDYSPSIRSAIKTNRFTQAEGQLNDKYKLGEEVGHGAFATVYKCTEKETGREAAVKIIQKYKMHSAQKAVVANEIAAMHAVSPHPHIIALLDVYEDAEYICIVMELAQGGELTKAIKTVTRRGAAGLIRTILEVVNHCHLMGVVHRDIKPENFLLTDAGALKLADFGAAAFVLPGGAPLRERIGSPRYMAPEAVDLWSVGVLTHELLVGAPPYWGESLTEIFSRLAAPGALSLAGPEWAGVPEPARALVAGLLQRDPAARLTAAQALDSPWLAAAGRDSAGGAAAPLADELVHRLATYATACDLRKLASRVLAQSLPAEETKGLVKLFRAIDAGGVGVIAVPELGAALLAHGETGGRGILTVLPSFARGSESVSRTESLTQALTESVPESLTPPLTVDVATPPGLAPIRTEGSPTALRPASVPPSPSPSLSPELAYLARSLLVRIDLVGDAVITLDEFVAAALPESKLADAHHLRAVFGALDRGGKGVVTRDDFGAAMRAVGMARPEAAADDVFRFVRPPGPGGDPRPGAGATFDEFCAAMAAGRAVIVPLPDVVVSPHRHAGQAASDSMGHAHLPPVA